MKVKLTGERERLVYYVCESCGTKGAFSVSSKDWWVTVNHLETAPGLQLTGGLRGRANHGSLHLAVLSKVY